MEMINELVNYLLGAVHEFVSPEYWLIVDAVCVPIFVIIILICVCSLVCRALTALSHAGRW